jgi:hypothetical protein
MSAWTVIAHTEVGSGGAANITFSSIPATYTDLYLVLSARFTSNNATDVGMRFNGDSTAAIYSMRMLYGTGSSAATASNSSSYLVWAAVSAGSSQTANTFGNAMIYIPNYAGSSNKSMTQDSVNENNATAATQMIGAGLWSKTDAITSILLDGVASSGGNFVQYTSATLYGITKGSSGGVTVS